MTDCYEYCTYVQSYPMADCLSDLRVDYRFDNLCIDLPIDTLPRDTSVVA